MRTRTPARTPGRMPGRMPDRTPGGMPDQERGRDTGRSHTPGAGRAHVSTVLVLLVIALSVAGCAAGANPDVGVAAPDGDVAGFWLGLWQGVIAPITFVISLFSDNVGIYEVHNNGGWYDFGYVLGLGMIVGGSSAASR